jgi:dethiobiotin synthetase
MRLLQAEGLKVVGMKPVASGSDWNGERWVNEDAQALWKASSLSVKLEWVNPYAFELPVSPHIAAQKMGERVELSRLRDAYGRLTADADCVVVEGVGGWRVPLSDDMDVADLAKALELPVLLVVGLRLGCINHARLTHESMLQSGVSVAGWIANNLEAGLLHAEEAVETLSLELGAEPLAVLPFQAGSSKVLNDLKAWNSAEILRICGP